MKYKLTFTAEPAVIERLKIKKVYPFELGGVKWEVGKSLTVDDLRPFVHDKRELVVNPDLSNEDILKFNLLVTYLSCVPVESKKESHGEDQ